MFPPAWQYRSDSSGSVVTVPTVALFIFALSASPLFSQDANELAHSWDTSDLTYFEQLWTLQKSEIQSATIEFRFILLGPNYLREVSYELLQSRLDRYIDAESSPQAEQEFLESVVSHPPPGTQSGYDMVFRCDGAKTYERMATENAAVEQVFDGKNFVRSDDRNRQTDVYDREPSLFRHELTTFRMTVPPKMALALRETPEKLSTTRPGEGVLEVLSANMKSRTSQVRFRIDSATGDLRRFTLESCPDGVVERELRQARFTSHRESILFPHLTVACRYGAGKLTSLQIRIVKSAVFNAGNDEGAFRASVPPGTTVVDHTKPTHVQNVQVWRSTESTPVDALEFISKKHIESPSLSERHSLVGSRWLLLGVNLCALLMLVTFCVLSAIRRKKL